MNCEDINSKLGEFLNNKLSPKDKAAFEKHLEECPNCKLDVELYARAKKIDEKQKSSSIVDIVMQKIDAEGDSTLKNHIKEICLKYIQTIELNKKLFEDYWKTFDEKNYLGRNLSFFSQAESKGAALFGADSEAAAELIVLVLFNNALSDLELATAKGNKIDISSKKWKKQQLSTLSELPEYKKELVDEMWDWLINYLTSND